jgi:hypothetical protein
VKGSHARGERLHKPAGIKADAAKAHSLPSEGVSVFLV